MNLELAVSQRDSEVEQEEVRRVQAFLAPVCAVSRWLSADGCWPGGACKGARGRPEVFRAVSLLAPPGLLPVAEGVGRLPELYCM